jgi:hypothetical protein
MRLEVEWDSQAFQRLSFCEHVSVSAKPRETQLLKVMRRSRLAELPRLFLGGDVLIVKGIPWVFQ